MPAAVKRKSREQGILHALLPGARLDKNTNKIVVRIGTSNETIIFNVGGTIFETYKSTLRALPNSPLADDSFLAKHYRPDKKDHFFDRDPEIFHCVLNYLRTGELHLPTSVCGPVVKSELEYWGIDEVDIEECCWSRYSTWASTLKALRKLEEDRKASTQLGEYPHVENSSQFRELCRKAWKFFTEPSSSQGAQVYAYVSLTVIFVSIFAFCAQTHELFRVEESHRIINETATSLSPSSSPLSPTSSLSSAAAAAPTVLAAPTGLDMSTAPNDVTYLTSPSPQAVVNDEDYNTVVITKPHPALYYVDLSCLIFFIIELVLRFLVSPRKCRFIILPMTIIEFLAILPDLIDLILRLVISSHVEYKRVTDVMGFLKLLRVFRVFRLMRHIPGLWILMYTLKASMKDLLLLLLFVFVGMLVFSSLVYFAEHNTSEEFSSIPKCFWWAVITMTTVGYGDMYPSTAWGYLVGTLTGISGVLMIGFTVPVLVNNFIMYYSHTTSTIDREKHRKEFASTTSLHKVGKHKNANGSSGKGSGGMSLLGGGGFGGLGGSSFGETLMGLGSFRMDSESKDSNANEKGNTSDNVGDADGDGGGGCEDGGGGGNKHAGALEDVTGSDLDEDSCRETTPL